LRGVGRHHDGRNGDLERLVVDKVTHSYFLPIE
jgi:hypothetical protein